MTYEIIGINKLNFSDKFPYWNDTFYEDDQVLLIQGDIEVNGNLSLDSSTQILEAFNIADSGEYFNKIVILGNLTIKGSLINAGSDTGIYLFVEGNVKARNIVGGGSWIVITGDADIEECIYGHYNDGAIIIDGAINAKVTISDDHFMTEGDDFKDIKKLLRKEIKSQEDILSFLIEGDSALKNSPHQLGFDEEYYKNKLKDLLENDKYPWLQPKILNTVPQELRTEEVCKLAIQIFNQNVKYIPKHMQCKEIYFFAMQQRNEHASLYILDSSIPKKFITEELCIEYLNSCKGYKNAFNKHIPEKFKTRKVLETAISLQAVTLDWPRDIPEQFLRDKDIVADIVKYGKQDEYKILGLNIMSAFGIGNKSFDPYFKTYEEYEYVFKKIGKEEEFKSFAKLKKTDI